MHGPLLWKTCKGNNLGKLYGASNLMSWQLSCHCHKLVWLIDYWWGPANIHLQKLNFSLISYVVINCHSPSESRVDREHILVHAFSTSIVTWINVTLQVCLCEAFDMRGLWVCANGQGKSSTCGHLPHQIHTNSTRSNCWFFSHIGVLGVHVLCIYSLKTACQWEHVVSAHTTLESTAAKSHVIHKRSASLATLIESASAPTSPHASTSASIVGTPCIERGGHWNQEMLDGWHNEWHWVRRHEPALWGRRLHVEWHCWHFLR